jgi:hypothetical protein
MVEDWSIPADLVLFPGAPTVFFLLAVTAALGEAVCVAETALP